MKQSTFIFTPRAVPRRRQRTAATRQAAVEQVTVVAATVASIHEVDFSFSAPVTTVGGVGNEQIVLTTFIGEETPSMAEQISATTVRFRFDGGAVEAGLSWQIDAVPEGLDFHGAVFGVPQNGAVA